MQETVYVHIHSGNMTLTETYYECQNFHGLLLFRNPEELERVKEGVHNMIERAQRLDGTCTGEHGVGHGKMAYLVNELGEGTMEVLRKIKRQIDEKNNCSIVCFSIYSF